MRILFVCSANTCRSPMAEALFRQKLQAKGSDIEIQSAGTSAFNGDPISPHVLTVLEEWGIQISHQSQRINPELIEWADLVLTLNKNQKYMLLTIFPELVAKTFTLKEFIGDSVDIINPVGGDLSKYRQCATELDKVLHRLQEKLHYVESRRLNE